MKRICLVSTGQPSTNPRLVKEADALAENGYDVTALCSFWSDWAYETDRDLLAKCAWKCIYIGGTPSKSRVIFYYTKFRFKFLKIINKIICIPKKYILSRTTPELIKAAKRIKADLYIGHNLGALPVVVAAARANRSKAGFDVEDFYSGMNSYAHNFSYEDKFVENIEKKYIKLCDYVTSSSYKISRAYSVKYNIKEPLTILNVFPINNQSSKFNTHKLQYPISLYWFSQTIGNDRGLKSIINAMSFMKTDVELNLRGHLISSEKYVKELKKYAELNRVKVEFHDTMPPNEMVKLASEHDIGLSVEMNKPFNRDICLTNKIFTYILAGIPVLLSKTSAQEEIAKELGEAAILIDINKPEEVAKKLDDYFSSPEKIERARNMAKHLGKTRYNWDVEKQKYLKLIKNSLLK